VKPARFAYSAPTTVAEAVAILAAEDEARVLAGGQSLVPTMNFRLARPSRLVDINRIAGLDFVAVRDGRLRIGALARHRAFERPLAEGPVGALLPRVARHIAHPPIRNRGTFAGSIAHADPASEWCGLALALNATVVAEGPGGRREIAAADFFEGVFATALAPSELVAEVELPLLGAEWRCGFAEFSRRAGDYAIVMALAVLRLEAGRIAEARIVLGNVEDRPLRAPAAEALLAGEAPRPEVFVAAGAAAAAGVAPHQDIHADAAYKRDLVRAMVRRALVDACGP
jgi:carbon-monoxide dehydrogenase medium subunit